MSLLNLSQYCFCFMFWFFGHKTSGILVPWPGIWTHTACTGRWSLNHQTTRGVPLVRILSASSGWGWGWRDVAVNKVGPERQAIWCASRTWNLGILQTGGVSGVTCTQSEPGLPIPSGADRLFHAGGPHGPCIPQGLPPAVGPAPVKGGRTCFPISLMRPVCNKFFPEYSMEVGKLKGNFKEENLANTTPTSQLRSIYINSHQSCG